MVNAAEGGGGYNPSGWLTTPVAEDAIPDEWEAIMNARDKIPSFGSMALKAWEEMGGDSIPDAWSEMLAGDWKDVSKVADALRNLGKFCESYASSLDSAVLQAQSGWTGEASNAMVTYFAGVSAQLDGLKANCDEIADACNGAAFGVYECGQSVEDGIEAIFDLVITAAIALAAAAASSWTVVGGLTGAAAAGAAIIAAISKVKLVLDAIDLAFQIANGTLGVIATSASAIAESVDVSLPGDYDNKVV
ncbi:hypothetical protein GCM10009867_05520 [Pedococcus aerophilus]|uniref:WXG100 family type VII secretion target n=1 Tax=Pedococcus aerophilus TaxID=436356 RepID=A0ABN3UGB3_9MICO